MGAKTHYVYPHKARRTKEEWENVVTKKDWWKSDAISVQAHIWPLREAARLRGSHGGRSFLPLCALWTVVIYTKDIHTYVANMNLPLVSYSKKKEILSIEAALKEVCCINDGSRYIR